MKYVHDLAGCVPSALGSYLKALGILRIVHEQRDSAARGWWQDDRFWMATELSREALLAFFLRDYRPSPITSPWNKGSGFFARTDPGLAPLESSTTARFAPLRDGIAAARALLADIASADGAVRAIKAETKGKGLSGAERDRLRANPDYHHRFLHPN